MAATHLSHILLRQYLKENSTRARELFDRIKPSRNGGPSVSEVLAEQHALVSHTLHDSLKIQSWTLAAFLNDLARYEGYKQSPNAREPNWSPPASESEKTCTIAAEQAAIVFFDLT